MEKNKRQPDEKPMVVHFSAWWVLVFLLITFGAGLAGGIAGQQAFQPDLPPLADNNKGITTVVQEVTVSPNKAAAELVDSTGRSVFLLMRDERAVGMAATVTNDGLVVTAGEVRGDLTAYDNEGREVAVEYVGADPLFNVSYLRLPKTVVSPLDLRADDAPVGQSLIATSRDEETFSAKVRSTTINQYELPGGGTAAGIQKVLRSSANLSDILPGTPLLDEEGKLAGIWLGDDTVIPVNLVRASLERFANNARENNPLEEMGVGVTYGFVRLPEEQAVSFGMKLTTVKAGSPAANAGLKTGDTITAINSQPLLWKEAVVSRIPKADFNVSYLRGTEVGTATIQLPK